jgi:hypothetical protein
METECVPDAVPWVKAIHTRWGSAGAIGVLLSVAFVN